MSNFLKISILLFVLVYFNGQVNGQTFQFINGNWFNGKSFKKQTFYAVNGLFSTKKPIQIDRVFDLQNGFVIPPFADAHCHHFDGAYNLAQQVNMYLKDGVFYAKVQTNVKSGAAQTKSKVNLPKSVDVSFSHGALTHTHGHGIEVYESLALGFYNEKYNENLSKIAASRIRENDAYYIIDTAQDLENKWQKIVDGKPDFIKIYLLTSEDFADNRQKIPNIPLGSIGIDPKLVPSIVEKAHQAGLKVSAHVDTLFDYQTALNAGVDEMAHLPGYYVGLNDKLEKYLLTEEVVKESARRKIWIVPAPIAHGQIDPETRKKTDLALKHNLSLLKKHKVKIAFGSDRYGSTPLNDVLYLQKLEIFSNLEMLKIWSEETPLAIFPNQKIGQLKDNYEASFIVLAENPINNFEAVKNITFRFKQGQLIQVQ